MLEQENAGYVERSGGMSSLAQSVDAADDFTMSFTVEATPDRVYATINDVRSWWLGDIVGRSEQIGDEFTYRYEDLHRSTQKVIELVPGRRVVWEVTDAYLSHSADPEDWTGSHVVFDIVPSGRADRGPLHRTKACDRHCRATTTASMGWNHYAGAVLPSVI